MIREWQIVESHRDATHEFREGPDGFTCKVCQKPRWAHTFDGFVPSSSPSRLSTHPKDRYRGSHPYWFRPGTIRISKDEQKQMDEFIKRAAAIAATARAKSAKSKSP